jgi:hypothetical protein
MIPTLLASGIILYGIIQLITALIAVVLAVKWNKYEFLPGLSFLLLYALIEVIDLFFFTIVNSIFIDVAQFGFILIAILFFIVGMHPSWSQKLVVGKMEKNTGQKSPRNESAFSILKKF